MFEFKQMNDEAKAKADVLRVKAEELLALFNERVKPEERSEASRLMNLARTNLELSIMLAIKALSRL